MGAPSKRVRKTRSASEFDPKRLTAALAPPAQAPNVYAWSLVEIMSARDAQMRGQFALPARLAASMRTNSALFVARTNRLDPQRCIQVEIVPAKGVRALSIAGEAEATYGQEGVGISPGARADINGCLADHGVAFAYNTWTPREDGSRIDVEVRYWPIEHVRWDAYKRCFVTRVDPTVAVEGFGGEVEIVHGDGRWIIFSNHDHEPFNQSAAIVPGALVWAAHAYAGRDWAKSSVAHGTAKVVGEMPAGVPLQKDGAISPEAAAFAELLRAIATSDAACGIRPAGSKVDFLSNTATAWQIFKELVDNAEGAAARIYLGTDGTLGAKGGAPGVDVQALFGVAATKVQGDLGTMQRGIATGSIVIWTAVNFGDSTLAPTRRYMLPDSDGDAARASLRTRTESFFAHVEAAKKGGFTIDQAYVDGVAKLYDVEPPKLLAPAPVKSAA